MNIIGIIAGVSCFIYALIYDFQLAIILTLFFIAIKSDIVILIDQKIELLVNMISKKL